ncbi:MAG: hypothetical protein LN417_04205 [Candidatus Thermoplasmatota archaeon]|nr:hypothetical protein [Candidatus Thermoplasmatota archaeon]
MSKWFEPYDIAEDYEDILKRIAGGEFQKLKAEVARLKKEMTRLKALRKVFVTEDALIKEWDNEYDERWDSC